MESGSSNADSGGKCMYVERNRIITVSSSILITGAFAVISILSF